MKVAAGTGIVGYNGREMAVGAHWPTGQSGITGNLDKLQA